MTLWQLVIPVVVGVVLALVWWAGKAMLEGAREGLQEANAELAQQKGEREAQEAQEAEVRRQVVEASARALSEAERFALNLRAPFTHLWIQIFEDSAVGRPLEYFYQLIPPAGKEDELRQSLEEGWAITDHASTMSSLAWLLNGGHRASYQEVRQSLQAGRSTAGDLNKRLAKVVGKWEPEVGEVGGMAFDLARAVDIAAQGVAVGYLSEGQGWRIMGQCRHMARDAAFRDWAHYGQSFLAGAEFWKSGGVTGGIRNRGYTQTIAWLLEDTNSPWLRDPWSPAGQGRPEVPELNSIGVPTTLH
ncbi:DUF1266 domain-containing protein [Deinococcus humi]|uniref:DUF1266 domain-containing protein n=1 Tax=Deinococcus humi TaxID=662880 RepID=A0A7W8JY56_9DEIO|nr:DUF1266 domain-containing protein [Deinococcus humi]MBB5365407.1 hypothetical protein [Deinococcus humi]GGO35995.1 hypothetical protein GCM10008949_39290 [Deinococcus humi]